MKTFQIKLNITCFLIKNKHYRNNSCYVGFNWVVFVLEEMNDFELCLKRYVTDAIRVSHVFDYKDNIFTCANVSYLC